MKATILARADRLVEGRFDAQCGKIRHKSKEHTHCAVPG